MFDIKKLRNDLKINMKEAEYISLTDASNQLTRNFANFEAMKRAAERDPRLYTNQKFIQAANAYKADNMRVIRERLKSASRQNLFPKLLDMILPGDVFKNPLDGQDAFLKGLPDIRMSEDGKTFNISLVTGEPSTIFTTEELLSEQGGETFVQAIKQIAAANDFLAAQRNARGQ